MTDVQTSSPISSAPVQRTSSLGQPMQSAAIYDISGDKPVLGDMPHEQVQDAIASGKFSFPKGQEVNVVAPDGTFGTVPADKAPDAFKNGYKYATPNMLGQQKKIKEYTTPTQQFVGALEGLAHGYLGPAATGAEAALTKLGVPGLTPEEQEARKETNPIEYGLTEAIGLGVGALSGTGEAGVLGKAGAGVSKAVTAGSELTRARAAGALALRGAVEMSGYGAGDEVSNFINNDPNQTAGSIISHVGLSALLGAGTGAVFGAAFPKWAAEHAQPVEQGIQDFKNGLSGDIADPETEGAMKTIKETGLLGRFSKLKPNAPELKDIGQRNNWPVLEGMVSGSEDIQRAEDALLKGPPTVASVQRRELYQKAISAAEDSVNQATNATTNASETEVGNQIQTSLLDKLNSSYEPIKAAYQEIEPYRQAIPVTDNSTNALSRTIGKIIEEKGLVPGSERYNFIKTFADGIDNVDNLQKLANFRTEVSRSAGPLTKDLAGAISDKLNNLEDNAIKRFSKTMQTGTAKDKILDLINKSDAAKSQYAAYRDSLQELGNSLGKKKIYGPQNFMDFLEEMNPQTLARRTFNENNTTFAKYLAEKFPEEMDIIKNYQRSLLRNEATKEGVINTKKLTKNILDMQPEMQKLLYSDGERQTIQDASKYLDSMPKSFNPSGTAHESAFREFFTHPTGAVIANLRDFGIQAFIKAAGRAAPGADKEAGRLMSVLGKNVAEKEINTNGFKNAAQATMMAIKNHATLSKAVSGIFAGESKIVPPVPKEVIDKLDEKLKKLSANPSELFSVTGNLDHYLPNHAAALSKTAMTAVSMLNSQRPSNPKASPLDTEIPVSKDQEASFHRSLEIAQQPLTVLQHVKNFTLLPQDMKTLTTIYPDYYNKMSQELTSAMTDHLSKGNTVPYKLRQSMSLFLGQPLDSTMIPANMQSIQSMFAQHKPMTPAQPGKPSRSKGSPSKLTKISSNLQTPEQARDERANKG